MVDKALSSIAVGAVLCVIGFVPYVFYQYRQYGRFSGTRLAWMAGLMVYVTGLVAYTLFPLPDAQWCDGSRGSLELDPWVYFRQIWRDHQAGMSWMSILTGWNVMQMVLNVLLFMPLGVIVRHLWKAGVIRTTLVGFVVSLLIESTQYTGNWFTAACPYRVADVNDLMTNTLGAFLGGLVAMVIPRFTADADTMERTRGQAKPVTRSRRLAGVLFDLVVQVIIICVTQVGAVLLYVFVGGGRREDTALAKVVQGSANLMTQVESIAVIMVFALVGSGASLGQRVVYLKPAPRWRWPRLWLVVRAMLGLGGALIAVYWVRFGGWIAAGWVVVGLVWVLIDPRGMSFTLAGCDLVDSRGTPPVDPDSQADGRGSASSGEAPESIVDGTNSR
ncbi:MAG: VanZ family protein [Propionibacteriaceae bacterium]|jgi:glycopeptide antibiotics resistance protein|nr:VanZ family protein [Propionibacteriaceae bacterium]